MWTTLRSNWFLYLLFLVVGIVIAVQLIDRTRHKQEPAAVITVADSTWIAPSLFLDQVTAGEERTLVIYGEELVAHTSKYLGPQGSVLTITNGMNCQNCHLDAGTRPWGNNYGAVYSTYPKMRARSGQVEDIYKRVNDCFERSLNGSPLDTGSREMQALYAYLKWLGKGVPKNTKPYGSGLEQLPYLERAADPEKGRLVYNNNCQSCHGANGEGALNPDGKSYGYPPLWGEHSYNDGAGLYRLSSFASFVKNNMPFNQATHTTNKLSLEEAWDVAAFVNSQPRPHLDQKKDWPHLDQKPVDLPFGPYADGYTERQHKYGPFGPIEEARKESAPKGAISWKR